MYHDKVILNCLTVSLVSHLISSDMIWPRLPTNIYSHAAMMISSLSTRLCARHVRRVEPMEFAAGHVRYRRTRSDTLADIRPVTGQLARRQISHTGVRRRPTWLTTIARAVLARRQPFHACPDTIGKPTQHTARSKRTATITNRKSYMYMSFRLVPKSVTLNNLERRNGVILRYLSEFG